jgi:hypothetical protein
MARVIPHLNISHDLGRFVTAPKRPTARTDTGATQTTDASSTSDPAADFRALFSGGFSTPPPPPPPPPTAESVFGPNPWLSNPTCTGPDGQPIGYNPYYFATPQTAAKVAQMLGGKVVQAYEFTPNGGPFAQNQPNQMVQLPDGRMVNPGLIASFYTHGYPQSYVDQMVAAEVKNA